MLLKIKFGITSNAIFNFLKKSKLIQNFGQIPEIGFLFLVLLSLLSLLRQPLFSFVADKSKYLTILSKAHAVSLFIFAIISFFCLIYCYIISDFSVLNVYLNSNSLKPLIYKISASWGNHEGSLLLLLVIMCFYNLAFTFLLE